VSLYSNFRGWPAIYDGKQWRYIDNNEIVQDERVCKRCGKLPQKTKTGHIDNCISNIVQALNDNGIITTSSCCGHGTESDYIVLEDG